MISERQKLLFEFIAHEIMSSGGDGDGVLVIRGTKNIAKMVEAFETWRNNHEHYKKWFVLNRHDFSPQHVLFSDNSNENFTIIAESSLNMEMFKHHDVFVTVWGFEEDEYKYGG